MQENVLEMVGITKVYGNGFVANNDIHLSVREGEIHALLGENGAGKSTLMKVLFGIETQESGRILLRGKEVRIGKPMDAIGLGIGMVHQHFMQLPSLTVADNMLLGMEPKKFGLYDYQKAVEITTEISQKYQFPVDPTAKIEDLSVGVKQKVEILKALLRGAKLLILDEPTAVLTPQETAELFVQLRHLRDMGHTIIFISHKLREVTKLCDRFTVLRQGRVVGSGDMEDVTETDLSRMMVGRDVLLEISKPAATPDQHVLTVEGVTQKSPTGRTVLKDVSFCVRSGEILGIAGVEGNGQKELTDLITGLAAVHQGTITVLDQPTNKLTPRNIRDLRVSHIPEDRMTYGAVGDATILENLVSDRFHQKQYNRWGLMDFPKLEELSDQLIADYTIKCDDRDQLVRMLSGGNIQKVVVAREFSSDPRLIIANQPTRGIDVGASEFIRNQLVELRTNGAAVLLISADLNEILEVSDSIIVMSGGQIAAYFPDSSAVTEEELGIYMLGLETMSQEKIGVVCHG